MPEAVGSKYGLICCSDLKLYPVLVRLGAHEQTGQIRENTMTIWEKIALQSRSSNTIAG
jgi:hypothetical protein